MGMTMTQKILAAHAGLDSVSAGQLIEADLGPGSGQMILHHQWQFMKLKK